MSARLLGQAPVTVSASLVSQEGRLGAPAQQGVAMEPATSPVPWNNIFMSLRAGKDTPGLFDPYSGPPVPKGPNGCVFFFFLINVCSCPWWILNSIPGPKHFTSRLWSAWKQTRDQRNRKSIREAEHEYIVLSPHWFCSRRPEGSSLHSLCSRKWWERPLLLDFTEHKIGTQ